MTHPHSDGNLDLDVRSMFIYEGVEQALGP